MRYFNYIIIGSVFRVARELTTARHAAVDERQTSESAWKTIVHEGIDDGISEYSRGIAMFQSAAEDFGRRTNDPWSHRNDGNLNDSIVLLRVVVIAEAVHTLGKYGIETDEPIIVISIIAAII